MRKTVLILAVVFLLVICSCSTADSKCYYGFFGNDAFMFIYSSSKNTVYEVKLPVDVMIQWGEKKQLQSIDQAVIQFCGIKPDGIMAASSVNWKACCYILDEMNGKEAEDRTSRLQTVVDNCVRISQQPLVDVFSKLLGTDLREITKIIAENQPSVYCLDAAGYDEIEDIEKVQKYVHNWLKQIVSEENR